MLRFGTITALTICALLALLIINQFYSISIGWYVVPLLFWLLLTVIGSFHIRFNYHVKALHANKAIAENLIALTFDDGPHPDITPKVLELLKKFNAQATFFCIGKNVEAHTDLFLNILEEGHLVGNHTYSHSNTFGFFSTKKVISELTLTNELVENLSGKKMALYRPAFGVTNPNIKKAVQKTGLLPIAWSIRSLDTTHLPKEKVLRRITKKITKGDIVLLHDTNHKTLAVLEQLLLFLQDKNLRSVSVDRLLNVKGYA